ncbi:MAG: hypothetical protein GY871_19440, partial [Actinomycetales bacterium]|nr:hypothetical protein [Actinomycetales bacterium]
MAAVALAVAVQLEVTDRAIDSGDTSSWAVSWDAPDNCPTEAVFISRIQNILDRPVPVHVWDRLRVDVAVDARTGGEPHRAVISLAGRDGESSRMLEHPDSCVQLTEGAALVVGLAIE